MNGEKQRTWLIRDPDASFSRPMKEEELLKKFKEGEMQPQAEISLANGYWFSLHDIKEMRKHFGTIPLDGLFKKVKEEVTQERYLNTATLTPIPGSIPKVPFGAHPIHLEKERERSIPPRTKVLLFVLIASILASLFVWFC